MGEPIVSTRTSGIVCAALLLLTLLTTILGRVDLGPFHLVAALGIAAAKALLIVLYFMHVRFATGVTRLAVAGGVLWLVILLAGTMDDYLTRGW